MSGPVRTPSDDRDISDHPVLRINWIAHLALVLAALNVALTLGAKGFGAQVHRAGVILWGLTLAAIVTHAVVARRAGRTWSGIAPCAACAAGAASMVLAQTSPGETAGIAFSVVGIVCFIGGIVGIAAGLRKHL